MKRREDRGRAVLFTPRLSEVFRTGEFFRKTASAVPSRKPLKRLRGNRVWYHTSLKRGVNEKLSTTTLRKETP
jgi:hypothetical protein